MLLYSIALGLVASCRASQDMPFIRMKDLPGIAEPEKAQWIAMSEDVKFLPVDELPQLPVKKSRRLGPDDEDQEEEEAGDEEETETTEYWNGYNPYSVQPFIEGMGDYDEYQQAWRFLGFMIDCNSVSNDEKNDRHGSNDVTENGCARYLIWAAVSTLQVPLC